MATETWYVWLTEYPDEGSVEVRAETQLEAIGEGAELLDTDPESVTAGLHQRRELELLRDDRDRLAAELLASQAREAEALESLRDLLATCEEMDWPERILRGFRGPLASPSPAAQAIGKLLSVVARVYEEWADPRCAYSVMDMGSALTKISEAYREVEAPRSGQASHEDQRPVPSRISQPTVADSREVGDERGDSRCRTERS